MDISTYTKRLKRPSWPRGYNHEPGTSYTSNWDYCRDHLSNYHFDKWQVEREGDWWHKLGRFEGSWESEVDLIIDRARGLSWDGQTSSNLRGGFPGGRSPMKSQEDHDHAIHGLSGREKTSLVLEDFINERCPIVRSMVDFWQLSPGDSPSINYRIHCQMPGEAFGMHMDKLVHRKPEDPGSIIRIFVHLTDWEPGQVIMYGNDCHWQWRKGDIHTFDHMNLPHATTNLSRVPRPMLSIVGCRTAGTDAILAAASPLSRYPL